jgi:hypothetical protein
MTVASTAGGKIRTDGIVTLASGAKITFWQEEQDDGFGGFSLTSSNGTGGGRCFPNGMCEAYVSGADGHAFATTITIDGADELRILVTELDASGKALGFVQETLHKSPDSP